MLPAPFPSPGFPGQRHSKEQNSEAAKPFSKGSSGSMSSLFALPHLGLIPNSRTGTAVTAGSLRQKGRAGSRTPCPEVVTFLAFKLLGGEKGDEKKQEWEGEASREKLQRAREGAAARWLCRGCTVTQRRHSERRRPRLLPQPGGPGGRAGCCEGLRPQGWASQSHGSPFTTKGKKMK